VLDAGQLAHAIFPLGGSLKTEVRAEADRRGLAVADKPDSHDICFIADGDTRRFLAERLGTEPGPIVDSSGSVLGAHQGAYGFTVGSARACASATRPATAARATCSTSRRSPTP